ncbi:MAG: M56 family metallopeptidase [Lachnospiraceae bacterium]|nr:M56 family metallopeptidase [Lachnospiraceae bacterium]
MVLYICVSIAGSIPVIVCFILWILQKQSYDFYLGRKLLLIGMFFYLFPFQLVKHVLPKQTAPTLNLPLDVNVKQDFFKIVSVKNILFPGESVWIPKWLLVILIVWMCCVLIFAVYQIVKYRMDIRELLAHSEKVMIDVDGEPVEVLINGSIRTPYAVGFIRQVILVPKDSLGHLCFAMFYRHEDQHRKNHDSLMKLVCVLIICIHWINPAALLLLFLYSMTAEYICDARATEGCTEDKKKKYARLLVSLSGEDEPFSVVWRNHLSGSEKLMRRRINYMMKRRGMVRRGVAAVVSALTVLACTSTIFAYEPMLSTDEETTGIFREGDAGDFSDVEKMDKVYFGDSDGVFVYEDGTQVAVREGASPYAFCNHIFSDGYYYLHKANNSGGCTVTVYNAQRCTRCGFLKLGSVHNTITYAVCIH